MKPYPKYKDSGIEWLGEVPEGWAMKRLRFCLKLNPSKQEVRHLPKNTELSFIPMEAVGEDGSLDLSSKRSIEEVDNGYTFFRNDDVAIAKITPCFENGKGCIFRNLHHGFGFGTTELTVMRPIRLDPTFLYYITISHRFRVTGIGLMQGSAGQKRVPDDYIRSYLIGLPPEAEQQAIISFLDSETARIDALIQKKERMIELLKEKRIALITRAVTKGLDPSVTMKYSGIEWLGEVPEHWEVKKVKQISKLISKGTTPSTVNRELSDSGVRYIKAENIHDDVVFNEPEFYIDHETNDIIKRSILYENDLLIVIAGATIGKCAILAEALLPANTNQAVCFVRLISPNYAGYVRYWMLAEHTSKLLRLNSVQSAQPNISMEDIGNIPIIYPSYNEMEYIIEYLDFKLDQIDSLLNKVANSITLLREYRSSLIHHAVTGKIDLRDYDAQAQ